MPYKYPYVNNTCTDISAYHSVIMKAIVNGGAFDTDFIDIFVLTKTPTGSDAMYVLTFC